MEIRDKDRMESEESNAMKLSVGMPCVVTFDGEDCNGEVVGIHNGWIQARIVIDPVTDWGELGSRLSPVSYVMVRESCVRALVEED